MQDPPLSCLYNLYENDMYCDQSFSEEQSGKAYQAWTEVTGYDPIKVIKELNQHNNIEYKVINGTCLFIFLPVSVIFLLLIWIGVGFELYNWVVGFYLSLFMGFVMYSCSVGYRVYAYKLLQENRGEKAQALLAAERSYINSIAKIPQAILAASCAVNCEGLGCWTCNNKNEEEEKEKEKCCN